MKKIPKYKKEKKAVQTSFLEKDSIVYEQVFDDKNVGFAAWDGRTVKYVESIDGILPINDDALKEGAILLPTKVEEYGSLEKLVNNIREHIRKYLDISEDYELFATYYIILSWVYDRLNTLPYLRFLGDTGTGKSRSLDVIGRLCYKPCIVSGSITPAPIYRMIRKWRGTIVLDEADFRDSSEKNEVITILNCGFERGRPVIRCNKDNPDDLQFLPTFGPKVFSTRYSFKDPALESRCLTEKMKETLRSDIPSQLPNKFYEEEISLRNRLLMFRFRYRDDINPEQIQRVDMDGIEPRLRQATSSFAVIFANIPELMPKFVEFLKKYNEELIEERASSREGRVVNVIFELIKEEKNLISPSDIADKIESQGYKKPTPQGVGMSLKSLGLKTKMKRIEKDVKRILVWDCSLMSSLKRRYVPQVHVTDVTNDTPVTDNGLEKFMEKRCNDCNERNKCNIDWNTQRKTEAGGSDL